MNVNLKSLVGKLNHTTRAALEAAAGLCLSRTHYDIEIEHLLLKLLDGAQADVPILLKQFGVDKSRVTADLTRSLDKLKSGNARTPAISPTLMRSLTEAWTLGSLNYGAGDIRSGFVLLALLTVDELARLMGEISREWNKISVESLRQDFPELTQMSAETTSPLDATQPGGTENGRPAAGGKTPSLDQYTVNLTENARQGKIDSVLGRDSEIRQIVDILMRRRQNNPILTGEAGVGKTEVVEGFASRAAAGDVPPPLRNVSVHTLDLALLQAGAGVKGEFENRLKTLIQEVKSSPTPIILFIDEAHTMIGAGGQAGQNDAANLLKPALARGELRTIAATTWSEYKKYFEKDAALARRFQVVKVEEPVETQCSVMLRGLVRALEKHHQVRIMDEGLTSAVRLSHRYLAGRQLPDKAVSILDTACARLALGQTATPAALEDLTRHIDDLEVQERILRREAATGTDHEERLTQIIAQAASLKSRLMGLRTRFEKERALVTTIRDLRAQLEGAAAQNEHGNTSGSTEIRGVAPEGASAAASPNPAASSASATATAVEEPPKAVDLAAVRAQLSQAESELAALQGE